MSWIIEPYVGAGFLKLGMAPSQTERLLGPAKNQIIRTSGSLQVYREKSDPILTFKHGGLVEILFDEFGDAAILDGIDLFAVPKVRIIEYFMDQDSNLCEYLGSIISPKFGVSLFGFLPEDDDPRSVTLFVRNARNHSLTKCSEIGRAEQSS